MARPDPLSAVESEHHAAHEAAAPKGPRDAMPYAQRIHPPSPLNKLLNLTTRRRLPKDCDQQLFVECRDCDSIYAIPINIDNHIARLFGRKPAQDAYPHLHPADRELLISGTCRRCWYQMYGPGPFASPLRRVVHRVACRLRATVGR
jgi:hypothetical protein